MSAHSHNPDDLTPWPELPEVLRAGVRGARRAAVPAESLDRALERARRLKHRKPWFVRRAPLVLSAAAALLLALGSLYPFAPYLARDDPDLLPPAPTAPERSVAAAPPLLLGGEGPLHAWGKDGRPLDQARVLTEEGELHLQGVSIEALVEGPRARTLVDHVFHNPHDRPLEAVFEFPLPDGASPSFFTLFPGNNAPRTAAFTPKLYPDERTPVAATRQLGLRSPEEVVRKIDTSCWGEPRIARVIALPARPFPRAEADPALPPAGYAATPGGKHPLALAAFRGRIGEIPARSHFRILFAFEEMLPIRDGKVSYEYPLPTCRLYNLSVALQADARQAEHAVVAPADASRENDGPRVLFRRSWRNVAAAGTLSFHAPCRDPSVQFTASRHHDAYYLLARLRPDVPAGTAAPPFARHAVFLLDTSAGENAARFGRCVKLLAAILEQDPAIQRFNVLAFNSTAGWLEPKGWLANDRHGRELALARLAGLQLEGATDLSAALQALQAPPGGLAAEASLHCFLLSDGTLSAGDRDVPALVARFQAGFPWQARWHCYQTGLGEENLELFGVLTRGGGGVYRCAAEKDVGAAACAHRRPTLLVKQVRIESPGRARDLFVAGRRAAVYPGGELVVAARLTAAGRAEVVLEGTVGTRPFVQRFPVEVGPDGALAARAWGELAVGGLLSSRDPRTEPLATSLARHFALPSRLTSFALVPGDNGPPDPLILPAAADVGLLAEQVWSQLQWAANPHQRRDWLCGQLAGWTQSAQHRRDLGAIIDLLPDKELRLPPPALPGEGFPQQSSSTDFLAQLRLNRQAIAPYLDEADRRARAGQSAAAVRCLCGLLEAHPGSAEVARLVGYQLVALGQPAVAARVLTDLVERTPTDPAAHRAVAVALDQCGRPLRAVLHYEAALAQLGDRPGFAAVREELVHLLRRVLASGDPGSGEAAPQLLLSPRLRSHFTIRLKELDRQKPAALRFSATWNNGAAVELVVTAPGGKRFQAPEPEAGTIGVEVGPRRVEFARPGKGPHAVEVRLARAAAEAATFVLVQVVRDAGTPRQRVETRHVVLRKEGEKVQVVRVQP